MTKKGKLALASILVLVILALSFAIAKPVKPECNDKVDNDGDGYCDYAGCGSMPADPGCTSRQDQTETDPDVECDDGYDNDYDNATDMNDGGCTSPTDDDETNCGDGVCEGGETSGTCPYDCGYDDWCSDSDGGIVPWQAGTAFGYDTGYPYNYTDFCIDNFTLYEYYCSGDYVQATNITCSGNLTFCHGGACV